MDIIEFCAKNFSVLAFVSIAIIILRYPIIGVILLYQYRLTFYIMEAFYQFQRAIWQRNINPLYQYLNMITNLNINRIYDIYNKFISGDFEGLFYLLKDIKIKVEL